MDIYHVYADLKPGVGDLAFVESVHAYLGHLKSLNGIESYRITRRKLGLGPDDLFEFHIMIEFKDMAQFDQSFGHVASRQEPMESLHFNVNSKVAKVKFALYRDFPDPGRQSGQEKF